jgi:hypothetical protein
MLKQGTHRYRSCFTQSSWWPRSWSTTSWRILSGSSPIGHCLTSYKTKKQQCRLHNGQWRSGNMMLNSSHDGWSSLNHSRTSLKCGPTQVCEASASYIIIGWYTSTDPTLSKEQGLVSCSFLPKVISWNMQFNLNSQLWITLQNTRGWSQAFG